MEKKSVSRTLLHLLFFFACAMWFVAVLVRAARTEGYQILYSEGRYWDCAQGWYDDEGNVCNIEEYLFTEDDVGKGMIFHYRIPYPIMYAYGAVLIIVSFFLARLYRKERG